MLWLVSVAMPANDRIELGEPVTEHVHVFGPETGRRATIDLTEFLRHFIPVHSHCGGLRYVYSPAQRETDVVVTLLFFSVLLIL